MSNKKIFLSKYPFLLLLLLSTLGGCNTFSGMGKDISTSADWAKGKMGSQDNTSSQQNTTDQSKANSNQQPAQKTQSTK